MEETCRLFDFCKSLFGPYKRLTPYPGYLCRKNMEQQDKNTKYLGMWVTGDGHIRQKLLPGGRYDEARGNRKSAYQGRYEITGDHIEYWDDTGFTADGNFDGADILYHGGYVFYREESLRLKAESLKFKTQS